MKTVQHHIDKFIERKHNEIIKTLSRAGESCITHAKQHRGYQNQTSNLVNSYAYEILHDGKVEVREIDGSGDGAKTAEKVLSEIRSRYTKGFVLTVVAGKEYAAYVEALGYNVLGATELFASTEVPRLMKRLQEL